ncbi:hypothetical protein [Streptomyces sp. NPDC006551]|uniref:hypothetical protein n=1 Tax=Streptomyces sp. NPDC006551 TaxID=3157178 RepID=UPI0033BC0928
MTQGTQGTQEPRETQGPHPSHTAADWWVTAVQGREAAARALRDSATADDLLGTLRALDHARRGADLSVGAAVEALLASGQSWEAVAGALGVDSADEARRISQSWREEARKAADHRLTR